MGLSNNSNLWVHFLEPLFWWIFWKFFQIWTLYDSANSKRHHLCNQYQSDLQIHQSLHSNSCHLIITVLVIFFWLFTRGSLIWSYFFPTLIFVKPNLEKITTLVEIPQQKVRDLRRHPPNKTLGNSSVILSLWTGKIYVYIDFSYCSIEFKKKNSWIFICYINQPLKFRLQHPRFFHWRKANTLHVSATSCWTQHRWSLPGELAATLCLRC